MKAKGPTNERNSESRVRENRLHGLMRGRRRKRTKPCASLRMRRKITPKPGMSGVIHCRPGRADWPDETPVRIIGERDYNVIARDDRGRKGVFPRRS